MVSRRAAQPKPGRLAGEPDASGLLALSALGRIGLSATTGALAVCAAAVVVHVGAGAWSVAIGLSVLNGALALGLLALALRRGRRVSVVVVIAVFCLVTFAVKPLYVLAHHGEWTTFHWSASPLASLTQYSSQDLAYFFTNTYGGVPLDAIITALEIGLAFTAASLITYWVWGAGGHPIRLPRAFPEARAWVVLAWSIPVTLFAQAEIIRRGGGVGGALRNLNTQATVQAHFWLFVVANLSFVAVLLVLALDPVQGLGQKLLVTAVVFERLGFGALTGARNRVVLPALILLVVYHYCVRPLSRRAYVIGACAVVSFMIGYLAIRNATTQAGVQNRPPVASLIKSAPTIAINNVEGFDNVVELVGLYPTEVHREYGGELIHGLMSVVPSSIYPGKKPLSSDTRLTPLVFPGLSIIGGRPFTYAGELWLDFGLVGVCVGAFVLMRFATFCERRFLGSRLGILLWAIALTATGDLLTGVYEIAVGYALQFLVPLAAAWLVVGAPRARARRAPVLERA